MKHLLSCILVAVALTGCAFGTATPTPSPIPTAAPVVVVATATTEPTLTPLPPPVTVLATTAVPASSTPAPTATVTTTATSTRIPATRPPRTATPTAVVLKYAAPQLVEPGPGDTRMAGKDDLILHWNPVANLDTNECYQVTVRIINRADPSQRYGQATYLAENTCNSSLNGGVLEFTLFAKRHGQPDYEGLLAIASQTSPSQTYQVRWWVNVASTDQKPIGLPSKALEFTLNSP